jgi:hypothetical protein
LVKWARSATRVPPRRYSTAAQRLNKNGGDRSLRTGSPAPPVAGSSGKLQIEAPDPAKEASQ